MFFLINPQGLARLLTKVKSFEESLTLSEQGSTLNTAITVGDIYGNNSYLNLESDMIASFFAKFANPDEIDVCDADVLKGLLVMITNNIAQIAFINAQNQGWVVGC